MGFALKKAEKPEQKNPPLVAIAPKYLVGCVEGGANLSVVVGCQPLYDYIVHILVGVVNIHTSQQ